ncbi:MAG TPA: MBL fold metallo-hydrolase, partial [Comamonas sp.]
QGSAVVVRTRQHSLLFDAGPRWSAQADAGERIVVPVLRARGIAPDAMVVSHADSDHAGGAASVQQAFPAMHRIGAGGEPCVLGQEWHWDGVQFEILHPFQPIPAAPSASNANSFVLRVASQTGQRLLLMGDIEARQEAALVRRGMALQADVMVVPHHGSTTSSSAMFLSAVQPSVAIVQAGYRNRFGHPAASVLERYAALGSHVVSTPSCGAVHWRSWQPGAVQCERAIARRYWAQSVQAP